jgi:division protein CdvB (Snf7/Vps24/ESCRT-III family)
MAKVTGSLQKSTEIMKLSNQLIKLPQISQTMREMSMEMTKVRDVYLREMTPRIMSTEPRLNRLAY